MRGSIYQYLSEDHRRLENALERATAHEGRIEPAPYAEFRKGLLRHISMEEKILLPAAASRRGQPLPMAAKLRLDHGALAALLVPSATPAIVAAIRAVLAAHNPIEEGPNGVYEQCEDCIGPDTKEVLARLQHAPEVAVNAYVDNPTVMDYARKALQRAGHHFDL